MDNTTRAYLTCLDHKIQMITEKGVKVAIPILTALKKSFFLQESLSRSTHQEVPRLSIDVG